MFPFIKKKKKKKIHTSFLEIRCMRVVCFSVKVVSGRIWIAFTCMIGGNVLK